MAVLRLIGREPAYVALSCVSFIALTLLYLWSSQILSIGTHGISLFVEPGPITAALLMSLLFGLLVPLQVYAFRLAAASLSATGGTAFGAVIGATSMTCCAPVLLPSLLSLLGFSGVTILSVNGALNRFWLPLATLSIILLSAALMSSVRSLQRACSVGQGGPARLQ